MGPVFLGGWQSGRAFWLRGILLVGGWGGEGTWTCSQSSYTCEQRISKVSRS